MDSHDFCVLHVLQVHAGVMHVRDVCILASNVHEVTASDEAIPPRQSTGPTFRGLDRCKAQIQLLLQRFPGGLRTVLQGP